MIPLFIPLALSGVVVALWRNYKIQATQLEKLNSSRSQENISTHIDTTQLQNTEERTFDDVKELYHYQSVSWYALAFSAAGKWFYAPATFVSIPLLSYNTYHFIKVIRRSSLEEQKSPLTLFEVIAVIAPLLTGSPTTTSLVLLFSFGIRKLLLQAGNISNNIGFSGNINPKLMKVWALREGVEVEVSIPELQEKDIIIVHAGDIIALKTKVIKGEATICQYSLHKKMKSILKQKGDLVFPFTKVESGSLYLQVPSIY
jgi:cation transport ATPase